MRYEMACQGRQQTGVPRVSVSLCCFSPLRRL